MTRPVRAKWVGGLVLAAHATLAVPTVLAGDGPDRLDRFRTLAATRLSVAQLLDPEAPWEAHREVHALLDEEIVENLASSGVFASPEFLQDRLDGFAEVWGGATLRVLRLGPVTIGAFQLSDAPRGHTVRVYGRFRGEVALLATLEREGRPTVHPLSAAAEGTRFVVAWEGGVSGRGTRALRLDLVRQLGETVRVVWSTAELFPGGLEASAWSLRGREIRIRYELRYPGWTPGCEGQTEAEDVYRLTSPSGTFERVAARQYNAWHRDLRVWVQRLFAALATGDGAGLARLVPDGAVRSLLPSTLHPEPACDAPDGTEPDTVSVAASGEQRPWQLTFQRVGSGWRLTRAAPLHP